MSVASIKRLLFLLVSLPLAAQTINPNQIRPSTTNTQVLTTVGGVTVWAPAPVSGGGTSTNLTPNAIQYGTSTSATRAATYADEALLYHGLAKVTGNRVNTTFNEGTALSPIVGTSPATIVPSGVVWTGTGDNGWQFKSAGGAYHPAVTGTNGSGILIDAGVADYTFNLTTTGGSNNETITFRYTDANNFMYIAYTSAYVAIVDVEAGIQSTVWNNGSAGGVTGVWKIVTSGRTITLTYGTTTAPVYTLPSTSNNITGTKVGFGINASQTDAVTITNFQVVGTIVTTPACVSPSVMQTDGLCSQPGTSTFVASDATGHIQPLAEKQTKTDSLGNVTVACDEDLGMGKFDPRCSKYGNGGIFGPTPGQAMQDLSTALICYEGQYNKMATVNFPPGKFAIGTATNPTLILPIGFYTGVSGRNGNGTTFVASYNNVVALQFNYGLSATCSDGVTRTANMTGGRVTGIGETGCYSGQCVNKPNDNGNWPNGGPGQKGIFIGDSKGIYRDISVGYNGADGLQLDGSDSVLDGAFAFGDNRFFLDSLPFSPGLYTFGANEKHFSVGIVGVDNQAYNVETYGSYLPGSGCTRGATTGPTGCLIGAEYQHVFAVFQGDQSNLNGFFLQVAENGLWIDGTHTKTVDGRVENMYGEGVEGAGNGVVSDINVFAACMDATAQNKVVNGHFASGCYYFDNNNPAGWDPAAIHAFSGNGFFGQDYPTADAFLFNARTFAGSLANPDSRLPDYQGVVKEKIYGSNYGANVTADSNGLVSVAFLNGITPADVAPANYKGFSKKMEGQDIFITSGNAFVTLIGPNNGGHYYNCNGDDLNLAGPPTMLHYVVHYLGNASYSDYQIRQVCNTNDNIFGHIGWAHQTAPALTTSSTWDIFGGITTRKLPAMAAIGGTISGSVTSAYQYCYAGKEFIAGGLETTANSCSNIVPGGTNNTVTPALVLATGWTHYELYRTSTDPAIASGLLMQGDSGLYPGAAQSISFTDTGAAPINTNAIGAAYSLNTTGGHNEQRVPPASLSEYCNTGDYVFGAAISPATGFGLFQCTAPNTWTFNSFGGGGTAYLPLTGGTLTGALTVNDSSGVGGGMDNTEGTAPLASPGTITATPSTTGGTLAAGTYYYKVTAVNATGETMASPESSAATTGTTSSVALSWTAITGATSYKVYRGTTAGGESVYYTTSTNSYTDTNAASTAGTIPPSKDSFWADSSAHRLVMNNNNTGAVSMVGIATAGTSGNCATFAANGIDLVNPTKPCVQANGGTPSTTGAAGSGTSPTITLASGSTDDAGWINLTEGTSPTASVGIVTVTFAGTYTVARRCSVSPSNAAAAAGPVTFVPSTQSTTTNFVMFGGATTLTAGTVYQYFYRCN